jgi:Formate--tetrahydrofolate ligase
MSFPDDLTIARGAALKPVDDIAEQLGLGMHLLEPYGESVMKIKLAAIDELADRPKAWWSRRSPRRRWARARPPRPSASARA